MKNQALFSSKDKSEKLKCRLLHFLFGPLRVSRSLYRPSCMDTWVQHHVKPLSGGQLKEEFAPRGANSLRLYPIL